MAKVCKNSGGVPTLSRALDILELIEDKKRSLRAVEIQRSLNIPKSSLSRILRELIKRGYLRLNPETSKYELGYRLASLGGAFLENLDIRDSARSAMQDLLRNTRETVELAVLDGGDILYVDKLESTESIRLIARVGSRYSTLHASAVGKVFLSYMSEEDLQSFLKNIGLPKITDKTITDVLALREDLKRIRDRGFGYDDQECRVGVRRIAAPIFDHQGLVRAAIGIAGPTFRITPEKMPELGRMVKEAATDVSRRIGYRDQNQTVYSIDSR
ncbi:MAG: IclR family transcriptional regulator [bacterium]